MQIHELNNYEGSIGSSSFVAVDNGNDTGKLSIQKMLEATENEISQLETNLNGRIDNIIAGGTAPSAAEVTDARRGANGIDYTSLGDAIRSQVNILQDEIDVLDSRFIEGINLFNPNDPDLVDNVELVNDGTTNAKNNYFASGFIPVKPGATVCCNYPTNTYGNASSIVGYNANKERVSYSQISAANRLVDANGRTYIKYTFPANTQWSYFRLTGYMPGKSYYMYVYADSMPADYAPYTTDVELSSSVKLGPNNLVDGSVNKDNTDFLKVNPTNLNNLNALSDGAVNANDGIVDTSATVWKTTDYIPVEGGAKYTAFDYGRVYWGNNWRGVPYYDINHNYLGYVTPDTPYPGTDGYINTYTMPANAKYIRLIYRVPYITPYNRWRTVVVKGENFTGAYIPYDGDYKLQNASLMTEFSEPLNRLSGKIAIWDGDSICAADEDDQGGWPLRIGQKNGMWARNYGVSGGCIAENVDSAHSVCGTLDTIIAAFPNADYVLIEGGTNDADLLGMSGIGSFTADDFTDTYINNLDRETFSGALESIFYRLVTQMKGSHFGYIIPQKMGYTETLVARRRVFFDRAIEICEKWGIPFIDLWNNCYLNWRLSAHWDQTKTGAENEAAGNFYRDGQHLTTAGYAVESPLIAEWMKGI